jgi:phosphatidylinositol glycan class W
LSLFTPYNPLAFVIDFLLNVGAILLATTLYASNPLLLSSLLLAPAALLYAIPSQTPRNKKAKPPISNQKPKGVEPLDDLPLKPFLTIYRGCMLVVTCVAILAVDFKIFPRRFAKVESWGTSLMDLGVGAFVFSAGVVGARPFLKEQLSGKAPNIGSRLYGSARHSIPLLILGFVRMYSVKGLDYAEHVTEYGVHWNFFFTLGLLPPFVAGFQSAYKLIPSFAALAIILGVFYQVALEFTDLKAYILTAPRTDLFSKNREGIFSFFGYLAIFLAGQATGMYVMPRRVAKDGPTGFAQRKRLLLTLSAWALGWTLLYQLASNYKYGMGLTVSRRLANLPYFLWVSAFNCAQIAAFCAVETMFFPAASLATDKQAEKKAYHDATSKVLEAYNRNGLAVFLVANLLTGLVNMTVPTLEVEGPLALGILFSYTAVVTSLAVVLDMYDISIKM